MLLVSKFVRGSAVESFHIGYAVVVDENGGVLFSAGDPEYPIFIDAAAKPFQAIALLESGAMEKYNFSDEELALICATHNGEHYHIDLANSILKKLDLSIDNLHCGIHPPLDRQSYEQLAIQGRRPTALHNANSGSHAGMLAIAKVLKYELSNYTEINHPVQQKIFEKIKLYSGKERIPVAVDNSNTPTYFIPIYNLAMMYKKLVEGGDDHLRRIFHSMSLHPRMIGGRGRFDTDFGALMGGRGVSKVGAEGVRGIGLRNDDNNPIGIAIKVLSGSWEACDSMAVAVLKHMRLIDDETTKKLDNYLNAGVKSYTDAEVGKYVTEVIVE
ncbi:MAG: asparaginase [Candidatus Neomarinimicrobiota bacterium]|nr:asparaginase [Candidatus Neomarinimicrobiota bacterium]